MKNKLFSFLFDFEVSAGASINDLRQMSATEKVCDLVWIIFNLFFCISIGSKKRRIHINEAPFQRGATDVYGAVAPNCHPCICHLRTNPLYF